MCRRTPDSIGLAVDMYSEAVDAWMDWESSSCCEVHGDKSSSCQEKVERGVIRIQKKFLSVTLK